jgi:hypothetical protein
MALSSKQGGGASLVQPDFTPAALVVQKKTFQRNNVLIGDDQAQIRFLGQQLGVRVEDVDRVTDDMLIGQEGKLYRVFAAHRIDLSPEVRGKTGFWSAEAIVKGSAAINGLVKFAATLCPFPKEKLTRDLVNRVGDQLCRKPIEDIRATLWAASWALRTDKGPTKPWKEPWELPVHWLPKEVDVDFRLNSLYKKLVGYATYISKGEAAAKKLGYKPTDLQKFKTMSLDQTKAYHTFKLLSQWKQGRMASIVCFARISSVWQ